MRALIVFQTLHVRTGNLLRHGDILQSYAAVVCCHAIPFAQGAACAQRAELTAELCCATLLACLLAYLLTYLCTNTSNQLTERLISRLV